VPNGTIKYNKSHHHHILTSVLARKVSDSQVATFVSPILYDRSMCSSMEGDRLHNLSTRFHDVFIGASQEKVSDCSMTDRHTHRQTPEIQTDRATGRLTTTQAHRNTYRQAEIDFLTWCRPQSGQSEIEWDAQCVSIYLPTFI
jgi:hypothetical protein